SVMTASRFFGCAPTVAPRRSLLPLTLFRCGIHDPVSSTSVVRSLLAETRYNLNLSLSSNGGVAELFQFGHLTFPPSSADGKSSREIHLDSSLLAVFLLETSDATFGIVNALFSNEEWMRGR